MNMYESTSSISFDEYEKTFKDWFHNIVERLYSIFNNSQESKSLIFKQEESVDVANDFFDFFHEAIVAEINETTERIANFLKRQHILIQEYYDFREIQRLLSNSLKTGNVEQVEIITNILKKLNEVTDFKFELLHKSSKEGVISLEFISEDSKKLFEEKYDEFEDYFFDAKRAYYSIGDNKTDGISKKYFKLVEDEIFNY